MVGRQIKINPHTRTGNLSESDADIWLVHVSKSEYSYAPILSRLSLLLLVWLGEVPDKDPCCDGTLERKAPYLEGGFKLMKCGDCK